jgi:hypothetical protein
MEGSGQLLVRIGDLGYNRGRDGYIPVSRRDRATCTALLKGSRDIGFSVIGYLDMPPRNSEG